MRIGIESSAGGRIPREHVTKRMSRALSRLPIGPVAAHVRFYDTKGTRGGADFGCTVLVQVPRQPSIRVEQVATTPRLAFDRSYERIVRQLERSRERWERDRRYPKKYYVGKRLL